MMCSVIPSLRRNVSNIKLVLKYLIIVDTLHTLLEYKPMWRWRLSIEWFQFTDEAIIIKENVDEIIFTYIYDEDNEETSRRNLR